MTATASKSIWDEIDAIDKTAARVEGRRSLPRPPMPDVRAAMARPEGWTDADEATWENDPAITVWRQRFKKKFGEEPPRDPGQAKYDYLGAIRAGIRPEAVPDDDVPHWDSRFKDLQHKDRFQTIEGVRRDTITGEPADIWAEIDAVGPETAQPLAGTVEPIPPVRGGPADVRTRQRAEARQLSEKWRGVAKPTLAEPRSPLYYGPTGPAPPRVTAQDQAEYAEWKRDQATIEAGKARTVPELVEDDADEAGVSVEEYRRQNPQADQWAYWKMQGPVDSGEFGDRFIAWDEKIPVAGSLIAGDRTERLLGSVEYLKKHGQSREVWLAEHGRIRPKNDPLRKEREKLLGRESVSRERFATGLSGYLLVQPDRMTQERMEQSDMWQGRRAGETYERLWGGGLQGDPWLLKQSEPYAEMVAAYLENRAELAARGTTIWSDILGGTAELPAYMVEFAIGSGPAKAGSAAVRGHLRQTLTSIGMRTTRKGLAAALVRGGGKMLEGGVGWVVGAAMHMPGLGGRWQQNMLERMVPPHMTLSPEGHLIIQVAGKNHWQAFLMASADTLIMAMAETSGGVFGAGLKKVFPKTMRGLAAALQSKGVTPKMLRALQTMGYHGVIPEWLEEQVEKPMRAIFNIREPGADTEKITRLEWLLNQFGARQLFTEAVVVSAPMVAGTAVGYATRPAKAKPAVPAPAPQAPPTEAAPEAEVEPEPAVEAPAEPTPRVTAEQKAATEARAKAKGEAKQATRARAREAMEKALSRAESPQAAQALAEALAEPVEAKPPAKPAAGLLASAQELTEAGVPPKVATDIAGKLSPEAQGELTGILADTRMAKEEQAHIAAVSKAGTQVRIAKTGEVGTVQDEHEGRIVVVVPEKDGERTSRYSPHELQPTEAESKQPPAQPLAKPTVPPVEDVVIPAEGKQVVRDIAQVLQKPEITGQDIFDVGAHAVDETLPPDVRRFANAVSTQLQRKQNGLEPLSPEKLEAVSGFPFTQYEEMLRQAGEATVQEAPALPKPTAKPAPPKPKVEKRPPSRERVRQEAVAADRWSTEEVEASMTLLDAVAETLVRDGKIGSADELYGRLSITGEAPTGEAAAQTAKGATQFLDDGTAVIHAMEGADISTLAHEAAHFFRRIAAEHYTHDLQMLEDWAGVVNGNWTNPAEEKFARAFERYLRTGNAPTSALIRVFRRFKQWLKAIYRKLRGSAIDVKISPEVEALFGKLLGAKETLAEIAEARQLKKLAPRAKKELATLRADILSWYRQEVRDPIAEAQMGAAGWLDQEVTAEGQYGVEPTGDFAQRFPGEITDVLKDEIIAAGKKPTPAAIRDQAEKHGLRQNIPGGLAEDYITSIGGAAEYFARARTRQAKESDLFDQALAEMDEFAKGTYNEDMAMKIARYRHLQDAGADLLLDEQRTGKRLTVKPEIGEPPPLSKDVAADAEETLKQYNLLGEEIVKPLTKGKTGELIGKGEVVETAVGEVEITDELRQEAVRYFLALPKKATPDAKVFYVELREQYGEGAADLFNDDTNPMPEVREALLRAEKGGSLFGQAKEQPPQTDILFQARDAGIPAKTQRALNNVAITTAETMAKQRMLSFARWEQKVTAKVRGLAPDLADRYREQLDTVWHAMKQGTLEHMEETQLPYGVREKMRDFFAVRKILARHLAKTRRQRALVAAEKISRPTPAAVTKKAVRAQQDAGKEAQALLKAILGREERGARRAWLEAAKDVVEQHKDLAAYARKTLARAELTPAQVDRLANLVTRARTPSETKRVIEAIQELAAQAHANATLSRTKALGALLKKYSKQADFGLAREGKTLVEGLKPRAPLSAIARHFAAASRQLEALGRPLPKESAVRHIQASIAEAIAEFGDVELNRADPGILNDILNAAHELIFQEGRHNDLVAAEKGEKYDEALAETLKQIESLHKPQPEHPGRLRRFYQSIIRPAVNLGASLDTTVYHLFGQENMAAEVLHDRLVGGERKAIRLSRERRGYFGQVMMTAKGFRKAMKQNVTVTLGGQQIKMKVKHLATILGNMRDPDTLESMDTVDGRRFKLSNRRGFTYTVRAGDMAAVEAAVPDVVKRYLDAFMGWRNGRQAEEIDATAERIQGRKMSRPGAFPRKIDQNEIPFEPNALMRDYRTRTRVEHLGRWKPREGGQKTLIVEPLELIVERDARQAIIYAAKAPAIQDSLRLIRNQAFRELAEQRLPGARRTLQYLEDAIMDYQGLGDPSPRQDRIVKGALSRFYVYALGLKPHIWLGQVASIISAQTNMRFKYFTLNPANVVRARREMLAEVPELAERAAASGISFIAPVEVAEAHPAASDQPLLARAIDIVSSRPIRGMDTWTISAIYHAAKAEGRAEKSLSGQALIDYAGTRTLTIVERTQPTWDAITSSNLSLWARKNPWAKVLLSVAFTAQVHKNYNGVLRAVVAGRRGDISKKEAARQVILFTVAQATTLVLMRQFVFLVTGFVGDLARALFGIDDEEDYERDVWTKLQARVRDRVERIPGRAMERVFGNIPAIDMSRDLFGGGPLQTRTQKDIARAVKEGYSAMTAEEKEYAWAKAGKFAQRLVRAAGALGGIPTEGPMMYWRVLSETAPGGVYAKDVFGISNSSLDDVKDKATIKKVLTSLKRSGITLDQAQELVGKYANEHYERRRGTYEKELAKYKAKKRAKKPKKPSKLKASTIGSYKARLKARWQGRTYTKPPSTTKGI